MSVMLATQNPEAAARLAANRPLPNVGDMLMYHLRPGEIRAGRRDIPAIVLDRDADNQLLKLLVIYDHQDMMTLDRVPQRIGDDQGWEARGGDSAALAELRAELTAMREEIETFKLELAETLFGNWAKPDISYEDRLRAVELNPEQLREMVERAVSTKVKATRQKG